MLHMPPKPTAPASPVPFLDLRKFTRWAEETATYIEVTFDMNRFPWMELGQFELFTDNKTGVWRFSSYLSKATDFEHDSSKIVVFELVGARLDMVHGGQVVIDGYIKTPESSYDRFNVPAADFDPYKNATKCATCKGEDKHLITDYIPKHNAELAALMGGRRITIRTGPRYKDDE